MIFKKSVLKCLIRYSSSHLLTVTSCSAKGAGAPSSTHYSIVHSPFSRERGSPKCENMNPLPIAGVAMKMFQCDVGLIQLFDEISARRLYSKMRRQAAAVSEWGHTLPAAGGSLGSVKWF